MKMGQVRTQILLFYCMFSCLQMATTVVATADPIAPLTSPAEKDQASQPSLREWFEQYDQIRRDAEMTWGEKFQSRGVLERGVDSPNRFFGKNNRALVDRLLSKYRTAVSAMNKLPILPETKELQEGYTQYFTVMQQLFLDSLAKETDSERKECLLSAKITIEELDRKNKKLDEDLRKKNGIPRHRHS